MMHPAGPRDPYELAKSIIDLATGQQPSPIDSNDRAAGALGKKAGFNDGAARAASLIPEQHTDIANKAAAPRRKK